MHLSSLLSYRQISIIASIQTASRYDIGSFLFREKMNRAAQLLRAHLRMTVKEVSRRVGFSCCNYFIRRFKGYFGVGPGEYRTLKGRVAGKTPIGKSANNDKKIRLKRQEVENISTPKGSEDEGKPVSFYGTPSD